MNPGEIPFAQTAQEVFLRRLVPPGRFVAAGSQHASDRFSTHFPLWLGGLDSSCLQLFLDPAIQRGRIDRGSKPVDFETFNPYTGQFLE
jgi:hypothetical protein